MHHARRIGPHPAERRIEKNVMREREQNSIVAVGAEVVWGHSLVVGIGIHGWACIKQQ